MLIQGNALRIPLADGSVHTCVTSPPYWGLRRYSGNMAYIWGGDDGCAHEWGGAERAKSSTPHSGLKKAAEKWDGRERFHNAGDDGKYAFDISSGQYCLHCSAWYGELGLEPTPEQYVANMVAVFREVWRVCRPDSTVWLNIADCYASKPYEPWGIKPKDECDIPHHLKIALKKDGWYARCTIIWFKPNPMPESVTDRPTKSHEYVFLLSKSKKYYYDADAIREDSVTPADCKSAQMFGSSKGKMNTSVLAHAADLGHKWEHEPTRNRRTVWTIPTHPFKGAHFATFPPALVEPCIKAGSSEKGCCPECGDPWERVVEKSGGTIGKSWHSHEDDSGKGMSQYSGLSGGVGNAKDENGSHYSITTLGWRPTCICCESKEQPSKFPRFSNGWFLDNLHAIPKKATVLDPFAGSGTTLQVARALGRHGVGLDLSAEYLQLARKRLELDKLDAWAGGNGSDKTADVTDLPMFGEL